MNELNATLRRLGSNEFELRPLGEVGVFTRGRRFTKADYVDSGLPSIHYGEIYTTFKTVASAAERFVRPELENSLRLAKKGDVIIAATGESVAEVGKAVAWLGDESIAVHDDCYVFTSRLLDPIFTSYYFQSRHFHDQKRRLTSESKLARISGASLASILVPVPPVEVQVELVSVLSDLENLESALRSQLELEIEARRRQYEVYRDAILSFERERERERVRLSEVVELKAGQFIRAAEIASAPSPRFEVPCFGGGKLRGFVRHPTHSTSHSLIGRQGALCGDVRYVEGPFYATEHAIVVTPREGVDARWTYHVLKAMHLNRHASRSAQPGLSVEKLNALPVQLPPVEEQQRIAAVLDAMDLALHQLLVILFAEIAARRKQYEYYRDRLLAFEPA